MHPAAECHQQGLRVDTNRKNSYQKLTQRVELQVGHRVQHRRIATLCRRLLLNL